MTGRRDVGSDWRAAIVLGGVAVLLIAAGAAGWVPPVAASGAASLLLAGVAIVATRRAARRARAADLRAAHIEQFAQAAIRLARLRDPAEIAGGGEALVRSLLSCDAAVITLEDAPLPPLPAGERQVLPLRSGVGDLLGRLVAVRSTGPPFDAAEARLLAISARVIAALLDAAGQLAQAKQARAEAERVLATIADGLIVLDASCRVRHANAAALRCLWQTRGGAEGTPLGAPISDLVGRDFAARIEDAARRREQMEFTAFFPVLDAWFAARCHPFDGGLTVQLRDITAQRDTEERQRQSQRLEALGQLTGGIAHDVNNLLTVIVGNFEMLALTAEERGAAGAADLELAEAGLRAGANASQLMHRLLAFSRRQPLSPQTIDVGALLGTLEPLLRRSVGEMVELTIDLPGELWHALADPAELENALINLAINARDAMPSGGQLLIEASNVAIDRVYAAIAGLERTGDYVMIAVADNGAGMTREVMERAFDPFFTTKEPGKGTGLGLSMVYGFARQSGGHVMLDSEPGQGTIIRLYLPRAPAEAPAQAAAAAGEISGGSETILLVEDNDLVRAHTETMLRGLGYRVLAAAAGHEALRLLEEGARPDLLLTDVVLPGGLSGRQVADAAARLAPGLRVLFTSGYPGSVLLEGGRVGAGIALISKPFRRSELAARVRAQLAAAPWRPMPRPPLAAGAQTG